MFCALCYFIVAIFGEHGLCFYFPLKCLGAKLEPEWDLDAVYALGLPNRTDRIQGGHVVRKCGGTAQGSYTQESLTRETKVGYSCGCWDVWGYVFLRYKEKVKECTGRYKNNNVYIATAKFSK